MERDRKIKLKKEEKDRKERKEGWKEITRQNEEEKGREKRLARGNRD